MPIEILQRVFLYAINGSMLRCFTMISKSRVEHANRRRLRNASTLLRLNHKLSACMPYVFKQLRASMKAEFAWVKVRKTFGEPLKHMSVPHFSYPGHHEVQRALISRQYTSDIARLDRLKGAWNRISKRVAAKVNIESLDSSGRVTC